MPELPEVETIACSLRNPVALPFKELGALNERPGIVGRTIASAMVLWERSIAQPVPADFCRDIIHQEITQVLRRGKYLVLRLTHDWLFIHLRMSGDIRVEPLASENQVHDRVILGFADGTRLVFNDPRKFGRLWLVKDPLDVWCTLGPEPFDEELTAECFYGMLQRRSRSIKPLLLDQSFIAGLGNIYTDEALFLAGIHPLRKSNTLGPGQAAGLLSAIRQVLREGIMRNGASIDWVYRGGDFQNYFNVYQRTGSYCPRCGGLIERSVVGQRGTHYCPVCQPLDPVN